MSATLVVAGDLCAAGAIGTALSSVSADAVWTDLSPVTQSADFAVVNVECPLADEPEAIVKSGPGLWGPATAARGIRAAGFTAASLANNHIMDAGPSGVLHTLRACRDAGLLCVGAGADHAAATVPLRVVIQGLTLSVLAIAENEFSTTTGPSPGAWPLDLIDNARQIAGAHASSDYVLVVLHGGSEHYPLPSPRMQKACRFFVDQGADAVVCHHTHIVGGTERYRDRPIVYGLGNLLFAHPGEPVAGWTTGTLARLRVARHETLELELLPYRQDPAVPRVDLMLGDERSALLKHVAALDEVIADQARLQESWATFCRSRRAYYLAALLCLTKPESWLLDHGMLPTVPLRFNEHRLARLRNLFSCESHHESCEQVLRDLRGEDPPTP